MVSLFARPVGLTEAALVAENEWLRAMLMAGRKAA